MMSDPTWGKPAVFTLVLFDADTQEIEFELDYQVRKTVATDTQKRAIAIAIQIVSYLINGDAHFGLVEAALGTDSALALQEIHADLPERYCCQIRKDGEFLRSSDGLDIAFTNREDVPLPGIESGPAVPLAGERFLKMAV